MLNLSSNDDLGFASDAVALATFFGNAGEAMLDTHGMGSSASRLMAGNTTCYDALETDLAAAYGNGRTALVMGSGYHANVGILPALARRGDLVLSDRLNHASILDGIRLSGARWKRYRHCDTEHLRELLEHETGRYRRIFIVTESIFSMDGDVADLVELGRLRDAYGAWLYVDEAHAVGVRGSRGLGVCEEAGCLDRIDVLVGTFGKALGSLGAYAVLPHVLRDYLVNYMRPFIFTTGLPPIVLSWSRFNLRRMLESGDARTRLDRLADRFRDGLAALGGVTHGASQIVPWVAGSNRAAMDMAARLRDCGVLALPVRPPTVPEGLARIRFSLCASMSWSDLEPVVDCLAEAVRGLDGGAVVT
jgi:8-amino-7-oxononanoate synthase